MSAVSKITETAFFLFSAAAGSSSARLTQLQTGVVQAAFLTAPGNLRAEAAGFKTLLNVRDLFAFPVNGIGLHEQKLKNDRDEVKKVTRALLRPIDLFWTIPRTRSKFWRAGADPNRKWPRRPINTTPRTIAVTSWYPGQPLRMS
jgi:hypothetical protein